MLIGRTNGFHRFNGYPVHLPFCVRLSTIPRWPFSTGQSRRRFVLHSPPQKNPFLCAPTIHKTTSLYTTHTTCPSPSLRFLSQSPRRGNRTAVNGSSGEIRGCCRVSRDEKRTLLPSPTWVENNELPHCLTTVPIRLPGMTCDNALPL